MWLTEILYSFKSSRHEKVIRELERKSAISKTRCSREKKFSQVSRWACEDRKRLVRLKREEDFLCGRDAKWKDSPCRRGERSHERRRRRRCRCRRRRRRHLWSATRSRDPLAVLRFDGPDSLPVAEAFPSTLSHLDRRSFLLRCLQSLLRNNRHFLHEPLHTWMT